VIGIPCAPFVALGMFTRGIVRSGHVDRSKIKKGRPAYLTITLDYEGGYSNDPGDPGGPTKLASPIGRRPLNSSHRMLVLMAAFVAV
jgi:glycosyl hydrolase family 108